MVTHLCSIIKKKGGFQQLAGYYTFEHLLLKLYMAGDSSTQTCT